MKNKVIKFAPFIAVAVFIAIVWPWGDYKIADKSLEAKSSPPPKIKQVGEVIERKKKPFTKQIIKEELKQEEVRKKTFKVTNPLAIEFSNQSELVLTQGPGQNPAITQEDIATKPQIQSAIEATKDPKKYASRLSPMFKASKFDQGRFLKDAAYRKKYVENPEPSRVWQGDPQSEYTLKRISNYYLESFQNEEIEIIVQGAPSLPISILSTDLGMFKESGLAHATVIADSSGTASFTYIAPDGTFGGSNLLVGGSGSKGMLKFKINTKIKPLKR
jgi:hypothetical protein